MQRYVLALDQGTTSSRAILFDQAQNIVQVAQKEFTQFYPQAGWVEQDPMEIYASQYAVMMEASNPRRLPPSASPTSGKPPSYGTSIPVSPSIRPSFGNAAARLPSARSWRPAA